MSRVDLHRAQNLHRVISIWKYADKHTIVALSRTIADFIKKRAYPSQINQLLI